MAQTAPTASKIRTAKVNAVGGMRKRCVKGKSCSATCIAGNEDCLVELPEPVSNAVQLAKNYVIAGEFAKYYPPQSVKLSGGELIEKVGQLSKEGATQEEILRVTGWDKDPEGFNKALKKITPPEGPLTGIELINFVKANPNMSKSDLVKAAGYVTTKKDGSERINFTPFYEALVGAKALEHLSEKYGSPDEFFKKASLKEQTDFFSSYNSSLVKYPQFLAYADKMIAEEKGGILVNRVLPEMVLNGSLTQRRAEYFSNYFKKQALDEKPRGGISIPEPPKVDGKIKETDEERIGRWMRASTERDRKLKEDSQISSWEDSKWWSAVTSYTTLPEYLMEDDQAIDRLKGFPVDGPATNARLRTGTRLRELEMDPGWSENERGFISTMDEVTRIFPNNKHREVHYRGLRFETGSSSYDDFRDIKEGQYITDPAFQSYSRMKSAAKSFRGGDGDGVVLVTKSPLLTDVSWGSSHYEQESVMPRNVPMRVDWKRETLTDDGRRILYMGVDYND